jgi:predicted secreted hydrolase
MMKKSILPILLAVIFFPSLLSAQDWKNYPYHEPGSQLFFPDDEGRHPGEPIEWWYTTAQVTGERTGNEYSLMLTYFYFPTFISEGFRIFNVANETAGTFFDETVPCNYPMLAEDHLEIRAELFGGAVEEWVTRKDGDGNLLPFQYTIAAAGQNGAVNLNYNTVKRPLMVGGDGFLPQGADSYTYYYSLTGVEVSGILTVGEISEPVSGTAWIDRQYGTTNPIESEPWEWFSLQLSNGMDINLWNLFTADNQIPDTITFKFFTAYIDDSTSVTTGDFSLERLGYVWMPDGQAAYARQWRLTAEDPTMDLLITLRNTNQEVALPFRLYEGATNIEGTVDGQAVTGRGFAELLHQYEDPDIEILNPSVDPVWDPSQPIVWRLRNPDDGRPVLYDVAVSNDNRMTFTTVVESLSDTAFLWDPAGFPADSLYWMRVTGYSADRTLAGTAETEMAFALSTAVSLLEKENLSLRIFPNPAGGRLFVEWEREKRGEMTISLISGSGEVLQAMEKSGRQGAAAFSVNAYPPGLYGVRIQEDRGFIIKKIMILPE